MKTVLHAAHTERCFTATAIPQYGDISINAPRKYQGHRATNYILFLITLLLGLMKYMTLPRCPDVQTSNVLVRNCTQKPEQACI